jgi:hypothetical protein
MKLSKSLMSLREGLKTLEDIEKVPGSVNALDLYLLAKDRKKTRIVRVSDKLIDGIQSGMHPGSAVWAMAQLGVSLPVAKDLNIVVPLSDVPQLISNLSGAFSNALLIASNEQAKRAAEALKAHSEG